MTSRPDSSAPRTSLFRRYFGILFAAVITPSTDALSMLFLWVPMSLLFELGIILMWLNPPEKTEEESEDGELVEI